MKKIIILFSFVFLFFGYSYTFALTENITKINFTSLPQEIEINTTSEILSIQAQDALGEKKEISESGTKLNFISTSLTGEFSNASLSTGVCNESTWDKNLVLTFASGNANKGFCYKDSTPGTHTLTVTASVDGITKNWTPAIQEVVIKDSSIIKDTTSPIITLIGDLIMNLKVGGEYTDPGATASDDTDGDITELVVVGGDSVDTSVVGTYIIIYDVKDLAGNSATSVTRTINISANIENPSSNLTKISVTKPAIKLNYKIGENLDITGLEITGEYSDGKTKVESITASNIIGFDSSTIIDNQILTIKVGEFTTTYNVNVLKSEDSSGDNTSNDILINEDVTIKSSCEVKDTDGVTHVFSDEDSSGDSLAICALAEALEEGIIDELKLKNDSSFGLYVENLNNIELGGTEYWAVWFNDGYASCGVGCLPVFDGDKLSFILTDWMFATESSKINLNINISNLQGRSYSGSSVNKSKDFSVENAISFLSLEQDKDKSLGGNTYIDWVSVALGGGTDLPLGKDLIEYLKYKPIESLIITDNIRRSMALMSLGINPYNGTEINYIKKIIDSFNGIELDDDSLSDFNDDIFGLIVLQNVGYGENDEMISKIISYIISKQSSDGSWGSVDMTGAGIMALNNFSKVKDVENAISKALVYLEESQNYDGGFDNISSTSWAIQALSLYDSHNDEVREGIQYLANNQENDGGLKGFDLSSRIWATAYAIPAVLKLSWNDILNKFEKQEELKVQPLILSKPANESFIEVSKQNNKNENQDKLIDESFVDEMEEDIEGSDLLANAGLSVESEFISGVNIIVFISVIIAIFLGGFVIKKILIQ